jgi:hypothetical protein
MAYMERRTRASANHIITAKYEARAYALHKEKLRSIKAAIDNKGPTRPEHLLRNRKREQMMEGGCA